MPVPLALAVPAAAAGLAYLDARAGISSDLHLVNSTAPALLHLLARERRDRLNPFYILEYWARDAGPTAAARPFLLFEGKSYTYAQTYDIVLRWGAWLRTRKGVRPQDIVALDCENSDLFVFVWFGIWSIGAKPAFLNYNLTGESLAHCIKTANTKLMLVDPHVEQNVGADVREGLPAVDFVVMTEEVLGEVARTEPTRAPDGDRSEDKGQNLAILVYTSGTTGLPKPAIVSWSKCILSAQYTKRFLRRTPSSILYTPMPLYHSSATLLGFGSTLESGSTFALGRKFSTRLFWKEVRDTRAQIIQYVGETCRYLLAAPPQMDPQTGANLDKDHAVEVAFGNGMRPDVWERFKERFGVDAIAEFYAATEGPLMIINLSRNDYSRGAIARFGWLWNGLMALIPTICIAVVDLDFATEEPKRDARTGFCTRTKTGEVGELLFKLPPNDIEKRFQGYYGNKKATSSKVMRDVFRKGDAYFRSGDVVRWDGEGRVFFSDRIGDTFRWKSENVSTAEVSEVMGLHPAVQEANVYGVSLPHHDGRAGCVALALDRPVRGDGDLLRGLAEHVRKALPKYAVPLFLRVMPGMGANTTGTNKHQKHVLRVQGVDPAQCAPDELFWMKEGSYEPFSKRDWDALNGGRVKL